MLDKSVYTQEQCNLECYFFFFFFKVPGVVYFERNKCLGYFNKYNT